MAKRDIHVVPHPDGGWGTRKEGASRFGRRTDTKQEAFDQGRGQAMREKTELVIHRKDGVIQNSNSYGNDPYPPKDNKH